MLEETVDRGKPHVAHHLLAYTRKLFNWAIAREIAGLQTSPCDRLKPNEIIGKREPRQRVLSDEEIRAIWAATEEVGYPLAPLVRLLLITGQRLSEVAEASWREIDLDTALWTIPGERMKNASPHTVPLSGIALDVLAGLPRFTGGDFILSTTGGRRPISGFSKLKDRLDRTIAAEASGEPMASWRLHDLRRTMRTHLSALPVQDIVRELVIGHARPGLHKVYDLHAYEDEKRQALELWASRLRGIVDRGRAGVADLNEERAKRAAASP
jgi:integrase